MPPAGYVLGRGLSSRLHAETSQIRKIILRYSRILNFSVMLFLIAVRQLEAYFSKRETCAVVLAAQEFWSSCTCVCGLTFVTCAARLPSVFILPLAACGYILLKSQKVINFNAYTEFFLEKEIV